MADKQTMEILESAVRDLLEAFSVDRPPVPIELMLKRPRPGMWQEVNLGELSLSFISIKHQYSPRMSVARLLARHIIRSDWGTARGLAPFANVDDAVRAFARAIIMPFSMLMELTLSSRSALGVSARFEVPEDDALQRLIEVGLIPPPPPT